jgi:hypothetical protein
MIDLEWVQRRAHKRIAQHLRATRTQVQALPTRGLFNFRCYENAVQWCHDHEGAGWTVVEVIYLDQGQPILHYLVRDALGQHHEVTVGWRASELEYYPVRDLLYSDHRNVREEFNRSLRYWKENFCTWWERLLVDRVV